MIVEVYCDASLKGIAGAWGAVVVRSGVDPYEASGRLRDEVFNSGAAELQAAANAIHAGLKANLIRRGDVVTIYCDNRNAVDRLNGVPFRKARSNKRRDFAAPTEYVARIAAEVGFTVSAKWVRGHQKEIEVAACPHARFNKRADLLCAMISRTVAIRKRESRPPKSVRDARKALEATSPSKVKMGERFRVIERLATGEAAE